MKNPQLAPKLENISEIKYLKRNPLRFCFYYLFSVLTVGILPLLMHWFDDWEFKLYNKVTSIKEATHVLVINKRKTKKTLCEVRTSSFKLLPHLEPKTHTFFMYTYNLYYLSDKKNSIKVVKNKLFKALKKNPKVIHSYKSGIDDECAEHMEVPYGLNVIDIKSLPLCHYILRELFAPFTIFQILAIVVWIFDDYATYAFLILIMMFGSSFMNIREIIVQNEKIRKMTYCNIPVTVLRKKVNAIKTVYIEVANKNDKDKEFELIENTAQIDNGFQTQQNISPIKNPSNYNIKIENNWTDNQPGVNALVSPSVRGNLSKLVSSLHISIGDVMHLQANQTIPADFVLLEGKCLVDESILTGETVPVLKSALDITVPISSSNIVYAGTTCLSTTSALGLVINTGFYTKKGDMVRSLLFTENSEFEFKRDSYIFVAYILLFTLFLFFWFIKFIALGKYRVYYNLRSLILKSLEMFTVSVPPALPLCLTIGLQIANTRLSRKQIFTTVLEKINEAGRISIMCFDKTGTLTESSLNLFGILPVGSNISSEDNEKGGDRRGRVKQRQEEANESPDFKRISRNFGKLVKDSSVSIDKRLAIVEALATCHSLSILDNRVVGDQIEVQLFQETGLNILERADSLSIVGALKTNERTTDPEVSELKQDFNLTILKKIEFSSERRRMSVVCRNERTGSLRVYLKGAPEIVKNLCDPDSLPYNFDFVLNDYSKQGLRIISIAYKQLEGEEEVGSSIEGLEGNLRFLGFFLFQNPLKSTTRDTIRHLSDCRVKSVMITGDNLLTAVSVAIDSGILKVSKKLYSAHMEKGKVIWNEVESEKARRSTMRSIFCDDLSGYLVVPCNNSFESISGFVNLEEDEKKFMNNLVEQCKTGKCSIAMTGEAFDHLLSNRNMGLDYYRILLDNCVVFGRTDPEQKAKIVSQFQAYQKANFSETWLVGFCGDGANDCAALRQADVGLSIAQTEASIAAPFNTTFTNISPIVDLFIEGKSSLETALQNFKYILYYSLIQFYGLISCYSQAFEWSSGHYYYMDLFCFLPLSIFLCNNGSALRLNKHFPKASLLNFDVLVDIIGHLLIAFVGMAVLSILTLNYPENLNIKFVTESTQILNGIYYLSNPNAYFFYAVLLYSVGALIFSRGFPFKRTFIRNYLLVAWAILSVVCLFLVTFVNYLPLPNLVIFSVNSMLMTMKFDMEFISLYLGFTFFVMLITFIYDKVVVVYIIRKRKELKKMNIQHEKRKQNSGGY